MQAKPRHGKNCKAKANKGQRKATDSQGMTWHAMARQGKAWIWNGHETYKARQGMELPMSRKSKPNSKQVKSRTQQGSPR
jgi:hypothetical protein